MNKKIEELIEKLIHKWIDVNWLKDLSHPQVYIMAKGIEEVISSAVEEERERCKTALNKVHDKYQNEFHGGYDDEETLNQRCIAVEDCFKAIRGE